MGVGLVDQQGFPIPQDTAYCLLRGCTEKKDLAAGRRLHSLIAQSGLDNLAFLGDHLIRLYASCGSLSEADQIFCKVAKPTLFTWNAIISGHAKFGNGERALQFYCKMLRHGIISDRVTFLSVIKACSGLIDVRQGRNIHSMIVKGGLESDVLITSALVDMHAKCGSLAEAYKLFEGLPDQDLVSWGAMIAGCAQHGQGLLALDLFWQMQFEGIQPDRVTLLCTLKACSNLGSIGHGRLIHDKIVGSGYELDLAIGNTLIDMYAKCDSLEEACQVFDQLPFRDSVSWSVIIAGYTEHRHGLTALELFSTMQEEGVNPSKVTLLYTLKACTSVGALGQGKQIHEQIKRSRFQHDMDLGNALIDMYAKCGMPDEAYKLFGQLPERDVISWGAVIAGYAQLGSCRMVMQFMEDMQRQGLKPNDVVFTSLLAACSHAGRVEEGQLYFKSMKKVYGIVPIIEHYSCIIDMLGRTGRLKEAEQFLQMMPLPPDVVVWKSLLTNCRTHGNIEFGRRCFDQVVQMDPADATSYVLMSSMYSDAHMWEDFNEILKKRRYAGAWKKPGNAWIEINKKGHEFIMGAKSQHLHSDFYTKLQRLGCALKETGHVPQLDIVSEAMPNEDKEDAFYCSEV